MGWHRKAEGGGGGGGGYFFGFKFLNFNIFLSYEKNEYFLGYNENFVDICLGSSRYWIFFC